MSRFNGTPPVHYNFWRRTISDQNTPSEMTTALDSEDSHCFAWMNQRTRDVRETRPWAIEFCRKPNSLPRTPPLPTKMYGCQIEMKWIFGDRGRAFWIFGGVHSHFPLRTSKERPRWARNPFGLFIRAKCWAVFFPAWQPKTNPIASKSASRSFIS